MQSYNAVQSAVNSAHLDAALRLVELGASRRLPRGTAANHTVPQIAVLRIAGAQVRAALHNHPDSRWLAFACVLAVSPENCRFAEGGAAAGYGLGSCGAALRLVELGASWRLPHGAAANHTVPQIVVLRAAGAQVGLLRSSVNALCVMQQLAAGVDGTVAWR
jgi:hypothetical protein